MSRRLPAAIRSFWRGEAALADAFWNCAFLGGLAVNVPSSGIFLWLVSIDRPVAALIVGYVSSIPYNVFVSVGVWRSADHYRGDRRWAEAARWVTLAAMVALSVT